MEDNTIPLQIMVHQEFVELAKKYKVDVNVVAAIVQEFDIAISKRLTHRILLSLN